MTRLKDIAAAAGVSVSTVSKALNNSREINEETRARIVRIARELNYNLASLQTTAVSSKNRTIGVICPEINSNYYTQLISSIGRQIARKGYSYTIAVSDFERRYEKPGNECFSGLDACGWLVYGRFEKMFHRGGNPHASRPKRK